MKVSVVAGIRKSINNRLSKMGCYYEYSSLLSQAYNGSGFYIANEKKVSSDKIKVWGYDKHWAYGGALKQYDYPLSSKLTTEETSLGIYTIKFTKMVKRYKDFDYNLYENNKLSVDYKNSNEYLMIMTHLDYEIFTDLYITDAKIIKKLYFQDIGKLDKLYPLIDKFYKLKRNNKSKEYKSAIEAGFYGMFAKKLYQDKFKHYNDKIRFEVAYSMTGFKDIRNSQVPIAMWQAAYLRYEEWQLFKKYKDNVVYMNTDSIYANKKLDIECKNEIGHYDVEYDGMDMFFIMRNAYIIFNDDGSIHKTVLGSVLKPEDGGREITLDDISLLMNGESIKLSSRDKDRNIVSVTISPLYKEVLYD